MIHGGCWLAKLGTFPPQAVALNNMRPLAAALTAAGIATWNIEYRRLGDEGGGWPWELRRNGRSVIGAGSPIEQLPFGIPQVFFTGQLFDAHAAPCEAAVKRAGDTVETIVCQKAGHFVFIDPQSELWPRVMTSVRRLLSMAP